MIKVSSSQFNYRYFGRIHFPYSISLLVSHLKTDKKIRDNYKFEKTFVFREKVEDYIKQCIDTDILLCSCYVWNWEITTYLAEQVKKLNPNCTIIFGGPQVPRQSEGFFEKYPFVDVIVHGEGEYITKNIFDAYLSEQDYSNVKGIETKNFKNDSESRINVLETIPSPYLTNIVWELVDRNDDVEWVASWETNRGCPYPCTFCDWGSATNTKLRKFENERLFKEIEWFGKNKIPYIDCCDANFGIFQEKDMEIATKLKETSLQQGYPQTVRPNWAKFSSEKIIPIAKAFQAAGLLRAVTLSVQSLDELTLDIIKRENIKFDVFSELTAEFRRNGIPTYTEIIMGLPGETLESFKKGLNTLIKDPNIGSIHIYHCGVLPNAPMNDPTYLKHHEIKTVKSPIYLAHSQIHHRGKPEYEYITVGAKSFTLDDLKEMFLYSWVVQVFHSFGILDHISNHFEKTYNIGLIQFYDTLIEFFQKSNTLFSKEYNLLIAYREKGYLGQGWDHHDSNLGDIFWPIEEASWLRLVDNRKNLSNEIKSFLQYVEEKFNLNFDNHMINDLVNFQTFILSTRDDSRDTKVETFNFDWKDYFINQKELILNQKTFSYENLVKEKDPYQWCYSAIWFGRFKKRFKLYLENLKESTIIKAK